MLLAIETSTATCSVALIDGGRVVDYRHEKVGRGHAERLIPMIAELPGGGRADHIIASCGPGSFTGIRVGLAAARGLALAWGAEMAGCSTLALMAAGWFAAYKNGEEILIINEGGHGEVFVQGFMRAPFAETAQLASFAPEAALAAIGGRNVTGSGLARLGLVSDAPMDADARHILHLPSAFANLPLSPVYGRGPDAKLPG